MRAPEAFEIDRESEFTKKLYGFGNPVTEPIGKQLLLARRLAERGVRFIQVFDSSRGNNIWDHHGGINKRLPDNCAQTDLPIAGFLRDLKNRGLLEDTLVVWGASSAARRRPRVRTAANTTRSASRCGWPAAG